MSEFSIPAVNFSQISMEWILVTAACITLFSLLEAWVATLILYWKVAILKRLFPATQNLIHSHIDYLIMAGLLGLVYFACLGLKVTLPNAIIFTLCIGAAYNPFGFVVKAVNPKAGMSGSIKDIVMVSVGFLPATIGFGYAMIAILGALIK